MSELSLDTWVGRERTCSERLGLFPARALAALLDRPGDGLVAGSSLPSGWHWLYFHEPTRASDLGPDGHERRGDFLPPVPLPRRMWAGGRIRFGNALRLESEATRCSTIRAVQRKEGRSGPLVFVTVGHEVSDDAGVAIQEEQDLVYRSAPARGVDGPAPASAPPPSDAQPVGTFATDPVGLFRFSALTFNGHRIHYDHPFATDTEGYPGVVVHGPLLALLLLDAACARVALSDTVIATFSYRALAPVFCGETVTISMREAAVGGGSLELWASTERGSAMAATVEAAPAGVHRVGTT
jgi:3-methylfumaryl-CoA hydratase